MNGADKHDGRRILVDRRYMCDLATGYLSSAIAPFSTFTADFRNSSASASPIKMSGQPEFVSQPPPAATKTAILEAISLREHSQTELILMSSSRCFQSRARQVPFANSASRLTRPIVS